MSKEELRPIVRELIAEMFLGQPEQKALTPTDYRLRAKFTNVKSLAVKAGVSAVTIARFEEGKSKFCRGDTLNKVGQAVGDEVGYAQAVERMRQSNC